MKSLSDVQTLRRLDTAQAGVYSKGDLQTAFGEPHPAAFVRRLRRLMDHGVLHRFCRGWYVTDDFDLAVLSQRLAPRSYISFATVLAAELIIGPRPDRRVVAVKVGRPRQYAWRDHVIEHVSVGEHLMFGFSKRDGVQYADAEKATLDTLYFHLRGRRYAFDIYSDISLDKLDKERLHEYLGRYRNLKFVSFANSVLELE